MTREEILQTFSDINHAYNNSTKYDTLKRMLDELTEPCEDCRTCNKWSECECGEKGHKNDTSIGYSIGECKDYEPCEDCASKEFIEIVVSYPPADLCVYPEYKGKPYYSIKYRENGKEYHTGFGTYNIEILSQWIKECFISNIQPKPKTDVLDKIRAEILEEKECAYADFERYKVEYLGQEWEDALDSLPQDDFRYGMERCVEIINKYKAESEDKE